MERFSSLKVGDKVTCSGYTGTVVELCLWTHSMVEVRLKSGTVCVDSSHWQKIN